MNSNKKPLGFVDEEGREVTLEMCFCCGTISVKEYRGVWKVNYETGNKYFEEWSCAACGDEAKSFMQIKPKEATND